MLTKLAGWLEEDIRCPRYVYYLLLVNCISVIIRDALQ
jgi:hypothetical protein